MIVLFIEFAFSLLALFSALPALRNLVPLTSGSFYLARNPSSCYDRSSEFTGTYSYSNMSKRDSVVWPLYEKGERRQENAGYSGSPIVRSPRSNAKRQRQHQGEETPTSPRLEVSNIVDDVPFSQNFSDLFSSLGLHVPPSSAEKRNQTRRRSYEIEDCGDDVRENDEDWNLDDIEGNIAMSPKRGGFELSTIQEEPSMFGSPVVELSLSDFSSIEDPTEIKLGTQITSKDTRLCVKRDNGQKYILRRRRMRSSDAVWSEKTILEMLALANPPRPFIDFIRWSFAHEGYVYLVLDYHPEGTLWDLVAQHGPMGSHRAAFYAAELVSAIASLHAVGIVHRDVDPRNIVLDPQGHILLTNFGLAKSVLSAGAQLGMMSCTMGFGENMNEYRAPEIFLGWAHDLGVDCWSLGMVLYFMIFGTHPFGGREGIDDPRWLYDRIVVFSVPTESLRLIHPMARDLITKCLQRNPAMRWTIEQIKSHGYFDLVDWDAVADKRVNAPSFQRTAMEVDRSTLNVQTEPTTQHQRRYSSLDNSFSLSYHGHSNNNSHDLSLSRESSEATTNVLRRPPTMMTGLRVWDTTTTPLSSDIFGSRPLSISITSIIPIPSAIEEEEEPTTTTSASASTGHLSQSRDEPSLSLPHPLELDLELEPSMTDFWAEIDREAKHSASAAAASGAASFTSKEFGRGFHVSQSAVARIPKQLRKYRSVVGGSSRLFSLSTASFQRKLRKKPRSDGSLRQLPGGPGGMPASSSSSAAAAAAEAGSAAQQQQQLQHQKKQKRKEIEPITNLPVGLHQIGSGIGFTYNLPAAEVPSRVSLRSFAPSCQGLFQHVHVPVPGKINRGLGLGLGLGLGVGQQLGGGGGMGMKKGKGKPPSALGGVGDLNNADLESERSDLDSSSFPTGVMGAGSTVGSTPPPPPPPATSSNSNSREVGNGTFIRDMYRTPSWILSRPESLPSPLALVNSHSHAERKSSPSSSSSSEPLTPATLVDGVAGVGVGAGDINRAVVVGEEDHDQDRPGEVNIRIPKHLELDLEWDDFRMWKNGSTLRLVTVPPAQAPDAPAPPSPPSPPMQVGGKSSREPFSNMNMFLMDGINGMDS